MSALKWSKFEEKIHNSLIDKLVYDDVNIWLLLRQSLFSLTYQKRKFPKIRHNTFFMRLAFFLYRFSIMILCRLLIRSHRIPAGRTVLITTRARDWGKVRDLTTGAVKDGETLYDSIIKELEKRGYSVVMAYEFPEWFYQCIFGIKKLMPRISNGTLVNMYYWSPVLWVKAYIWSKHFAEVWRKWKYKKKLTKEMFDAIRFMICCYSQVMIEDVEISKKTLDTVKPKLILSWALGGFRLAINLVGKARNIPVASYDYASGDPQKYLVTGTSEDLPDKFLVALKMKYELLLSRGLNENQVVFVGSPYTDVIRRAHKFFNREVFCKRFGLDSSKKIVVILSGPTSKTVDFVRSSFEALKNEKDVEVLIKPHPHQHGTIGDFGKVVAGSKARILSPSSDLFETVYVGDLIIGHYSTAIIEGLMFGTPAVTVNFLDKGDLAPYLREITLRVHISEFKTTIKKALHDSRTQDLLNDKVRRYLENSKCDGHATERFVNEIEKLIDNPKR